MRILHVVPTYLPATRYGGPIYSVHGLCRALAGLGHTVQVVTTSVDGDRDSDVPHGQAVDRDGVRVFYFRSQRLRRLYYSPPMRAALSSSIAEFDLVHLHSVFLWPTSMAAAQARTAGVPYLVSPRGMLVRELIAQRSTLVKQAWLTLVESNTLARAAGVHLTSTRELADARALPLPLPSPFIVPNGVDLPHSGYAVRARPSVVRRGDGPPFVLFLGRLSWKKGLDRLIGALAGTSLRLVICGNDEERQRASLEGLAEQHGVARQVEFEDEVTGDDKWALLAAARLLVLPSYNENFGNVVVEAMAVGTPVVVTEEVGAAELVRVSDAGRVCPGDEPALRLALLDLFHDRVANARAGAAGRSFVAARLSWTRVAQLMAEQYERAVYKGASCSTKSRPSS